MSIAEKLSTIAENEQKVYEAGAKSEYDKFWDAVQDNGKRTDYQFAFAGLGWNSKTFKPKYDLKPVRADYMFAGFGEMLDLKAVLEEMGKTLDTSNCTNFTYFIRYGSPRALPIIDTRSASSLNNFSLNSSLNSIEKIILRDDGSQTLTNMFSSTHTGLKDIVFEGVIGQNFGLSGCLNLTYETIISIRDALKDYSGTGETRTLTLHANCKKLLSDAEKATITEKGWSLA